MKTLLCLIGLLLITGSPSFSQDAIDSEQTQKREMPAPEKNPKPKNPNAPSFKDRVFFGGTFWLQFWGSYKYIEISPLVGYAITPNLLGGVGITYRYVDYDYVGGNVTDNQYGYRLFARYFFIPQLFAHAEYEGLNLTTQFVFDRNSNSWSSNNREWVNSMLVGGGVQSGGRKAGMFVMALYNVLGCSEGYCPYPDGWLIRVGVTGGF